MTYLPSPSRYDSMRYSRCGRSGLKLLRHPNMTSALIGASRVSQIEEIVATQNHLDFTEEELKAIDAILAQ